MRGERYKHEQGEIVTFDQRLTATSGLLDGNFFHRTQWFYRGIMGQLLAVGPDAVYGFKVYDRRDLSTSFLPGSGYILFAEKLEGPKESARPPRYDRSDRAETAARPHALASYAWSSRVPVRGRALVLAGSTLFLGGAPDEVAKGDPFATFDADCPGVLLAVSAGTGEELASHRLTAPPVWNGMAAADGRLYVATMNGRLCRMAPLQAPARTNLH
jgi:hypothetical protein